METPSDVIGRPSPIQEICDWARAERLPLESPADTVGSCSSCPLPSIYSDAITFRSSTDARPFVPLPFAGDSFENVCVYHGPMRGIKICLLENKVQWVISKAQSGSRSGLRRGCTPTS